MTEDNQSTAIRKARLREFDAGALWRKMMKRKRRYLIWLGITFVVSAGLILCVPRYYTCQVKLAPETSSSSLGGLASLASSFGVNMGDAAGSDAIIPLFYPDVMQSVDFQTSMFSVLVENYDGDVKCSYYDWLLKHQEFAWWDKIFGTVAKWIKPKPQDPPHAGKDGGVNPFELTQMQSDIAKAIGGKVRCQYDKKTDVITITVTDQDRRVCALVADSALVRLQDFIIRYRTSKVRNDLEHAETLCEQAKQTYLASQQAYAQMADANEDVVLQSVRVKIDELENEMQLQYNNYQAMTQQVQMARAKLQERIPAFTKLQSATIPNKAAGPKRMIFVALCLCVAFVVLTFKIYREKENVAEAKEEAAKEQA